MFDQTADFFFLQPVITDSFKVTTSQFYCSKSSFNQYTASSLNELQQLLVTTKKIFISLFSSYKFVFLAGFIIQWKLILRVLCHDDSSS